MAYIKQYWQNKEQRATIAREHTKEMRNKYGRCIQTSILGTKIYDTNSFMDFQFSDDRRFGVEFQQGVEPGGLFLDRIGEFAQSPVFFIHDYCALFGENRFEFFYRFLHLYIRQNGS